MSDNQNEEPYNGAVWGYSPYDMIDRECRAEYDVCNDSDDDEEDEDDYDPFDVCDDAEDYGEDDDNAEND